MSKKTLLAIMAVLMFASIAMAQPYDWYFDKECYNLTSTRRAAYDLDIIIPGNLTVTAHFDGFIWRWNFLGYSNYLIYNLRCLHWYYPRWDGNPYTSPIPYGQSVHVGAAGTGTGFRILDMFWTESHGGRMPHSVVWNLSGRVIPIPGDRAVVRLVNQLTPRDVNGNIIDAPWAGSRQVRAHDVMYAVLDSPIPLPELNDENEYLDSIMQYLHEGDTIIPQSDSIEFEIPGLVESGQYVVFCWENYAESVDGSDPTQAKDFWQFLVYEPEGTPGVDEHGSVEPEKFLKVTTYPEYTEIRYALSKASHVSLVVYSVAGERVASLVDETQSSGSHTVRWNTSELPTGLYFCRLSADGIQAAEKMIRLK